MLVNPANRPANIEPQDGHGGQVPLNRLAQSVAKKSFQQEWSITTIKPNKPRKPYANGHEMWYNGYMTDKQRKPTDKRKGVPASKRPVSLTALTSNQHVSTPKQEAFLDAYLDPKSYTFGNAYQSALQVGYNDAYARQVASPSVRPEWLRNNPRLRHLEDTHINLMVEDIATDRTNRTSDRLKALELSARLKGMLIERKQVQSEVIHVSLGALVNGFTKPEKDIHT